MFPKKIFLTQKLDSDFQFWSDGPRGPHKKTLDIEIPWGTPESLYWPYRVKIDWVVGCPVRSRPFQMPRSIEITVPFEPMIQFKILKIKAFFLHIIRESYFICETQYDHLLYIRTNNIHLLPLTSSMPL